MSSVKTTECEKSLLFISFIMHICTHLLGLYLSLIKTLFFLFLSPFLSKLYLQWCRLVNSERQYVALLKTVEETYLPLLDSADTPVCLRGKADSIFSNWSNLATFHSQLLLPAIEGALSQTLQQTDCFSKYVRFCVCICTYIAFQCLPI